MINAGAGRAERTAVMAELARGRKCRAVSDGVVATQAAFYSGTISGSSLTCNLALVVLCEKQRRVAELSRGVC